jgi:glucose-6-phosphate 1-epimerase
LKNDALIPDQQRAIWNHEFKLVYTITLQANTLKTSLEVLNSGSSSFTFNALLHTYFKVDNVQHVEIKGLGGYKFKEFLAPFELESRPHLTISQEVDRVYENVNSPAITLDKSAMGKSLILTKSDGFKDVVVWNPWAENAKKMADFGDEEYNEMICVEVGSVIEPIILSAGKTWNARQVLVAI